jgi:hypothetical protein
MRVRSSRQEYLVSKSRAVHTAMALLTCLVSMLLG